MMFQEVKRRGAKEEWDVFLNGVGHGLLNEKEAHSSYVQSFYFRKNRTTDNSEEEKGRERVLLVIARRLFLSACSRNPTRCCFLAHTHTHEPYDATFRNSFKVPHSCKSTGNRLLLCCENCFGEPQRFAVKDEKFSKLICGFKTNLWWC